MDVRENHNKEKKILRQTSPAIFFIANDDRWIFANEEWRQLLKIKPKQLSFQSWFQLVHPEDQNEFLLEWEYAQSKNLVFHYNYRLFIDNKTIHVSTTVTPQYSTIVHLSGFVGVTTLLTKSIISESRPKYELNPTDILKPALLWQTLNKYSVDFILVINTKGIIIDINRTILEVSKEYFIGTTVYEHLPEDQVDVAKSAIQKALDEKIPAEYIVHYTSPNGASMWYSNMAAPIIEDDCAIGALIFTTDITNEKARMDTQKDHQTQFAQLANMNALEEVVSGLAHEINQPLAAINNFTKGLIRRMNSGQIDHEENIDTCERIALQVSRTGDIIIRMRNLFKGADLDRQRCNILELINEAKSFIPAEKMDKIGSFNIKLSPQFPEIYADPIQIEQVIINVILNAIEAFPDDEDDLLIINVQTYRPNASFLCLIISDNGPGIAQHLLDKLFHPFVTTKTQGMGMGLSICKTIMQAHEGYIYARNAFSKPGSIFEIHLPILPIQEHDAHE